MAKDIVIDFIGMCVVIVDEGEATIGLLNERRHIHLISYRDQSGLAVVKGLLAGNYHVHGLGAGEVRLDDDPQYPKLPDLADLSDSLPKEYGDLDDVLRIQFALPSGTLTPQTPVDPNAENEWLFQGVTSPHHLTDRTQFRGSTEGKVVLVSNTGASIEIPAEEGPEGVSFYRFAIIAIDQDAGARRIKVEDGFQLAEFQLLYDCTKKLGPSPIFRRGQQANPDSPICPQGLLDAGYTSQPSTKRRDVTSDRDRRIVRKQ